MIGFEITLLIFYVTNGFYLQNNLLHLFIRGLELSDEDEHHLSGVVVSILGIHQRDEVTNSFEESSQTLETKRRNAFETQP